MAEELAARVIWKGKLEFEGRTDFGQPIAIDVPRPRATTTERSPWSCC